MEKKTFNGIIKPDKFFVLRREQALSINLSPREIGHESPVCDAPVYVLREPLGRKLRAVNLHQISRTPIQGITIALGSDKAALQFGFVVGSEKHWCGCPIEVKFSPNLQSEVSGSVEQRQKCAETIPDPTDTDLFPAKGKCLGAWLLPQSCEALLEYGFERAAVKIVH